MDNIQKRYGYTGQGLRVNLTTGKITKEPTFPRFKDEIGGTALGYRVFWDEVPPKTQPLDEANKLVIAPGPFSGSGALCSSRTSITTIYPTIYPMPMIASAHIGGDMAARLKQADYDFIFIDCPPSLELLTLNALCAADSLLVPLQGEYYALEGLSDLMNTVRIVRRNMNPRLQIEGVLLTMFDGRTNLAIQVAQEVKRFFPGKVYSTVIPRNVRLSEAPSHGKPITAYDRLCRGAEAYMNLSAEFLKRNA